METTAPKDPSTRRGKVADRIVATLRRAEKSFFGLGPVQTSFERLQDLAMRLEQSTEKEGETFEPYVDYTGHEATPPKTHNAAQRVAARGEGATSSESPTP